MAIYSLAISSIVVLLLTAPAVIDCQWNFAPQPAGHFNSPRDHNLGGSAAYQGEKNSFTIGAHSSAHPSGAKTQAFNGAFATTNNDGSNFQIRGGVQDSSFGPGYKQRTESLGGSYTTPGGINFDVQHNQMKDTFGNKMKSDQVGISHTFRSGLNVNAGYSQSRDNNGHKNEGIGVTVKFPF